MVNFPGRNGRRRRVLNEGFLSASSSHAARQALAAEAAGLHAPRYSDAAGVENHPQVTDFVPRKYRTIVLMLLAGVSVAVVLGALHHFASTIATAAGLPDVRPFDLAAPSSIADWISAVVLLLASGLSLIVYSIRRHRIDDIRGRYRIWLGASLACLLMSSNSVIAAHNVISYALSHYTGWSALRASSAWWLLLAGPPLAWAGVRALLDVKECRLARLLLTASFACYAAAIACFLGLVSVVTPQSEALVTGIAVFLGNWFLFSTVVTYARFVVLDAQGLATKRRATPKKQPAKTQAQRETKPAVTQPTILSTVNFQRKSESTAKSDDRWVDGSRPERKSYEDDADDDDGDDSGVRKLSKSDRKRLRKLKAQNRAA
jgi:hypothetical protein